MPPIASTSDSSTMATTLLLSSAKRYRDVGPISPLCVGSRRRLSEECSNVCEVENFDANHKGSTALPRSAVEAPQDWLGYATTNGVLDPKDPWQAPVDSLGVIVEVTGDITQCDEGTCGVWFVCDKAGNPAAVFKPAREEHVPDEFKDALSEGEILYREQAACVVSKALDGVFDVPDTCVARVRHRNLFGGEQRGSLQRFVADAYDMSDMGPSGIKDEEVHKIGMLDLLLLNLDRHEGNMLMKKRQDGSRFLIPIDHGLSLPLIVSPTHPPDRHLLEQLSFVWQGWQHSSRLLTAASRALAASLSQKKVKALARAVSEAAPAIPRHCLTTLQIGGIVLRVCVGHGMTLRETAAFVKEDLGKALAYAHRMCEEHAKDRFAVWEQALLSKLESAMLRLLDDGEESELCADLADAQVE